MSHYTYLKKKSDHDFTCSNTNYFLEYKQMNIKLEISHDTAL